MGRLHSVHGRTRTTLGSEIHRMAAARWRHLGLALATPALVIPIVASPAQAVQAPPSPTRPLPSALDVNPPYQGQTVCDPAARPGVLAFARLMTAHYGMGSTGLIGRTCTAASSEHYDGRAWDWMLERRQPEPGGRGPVGAHLADEGRTAGACRARWPAASGSCTSSTTGRCGAPTPPSGAGPPTTARARTPTTCTSASPSTARRVAPRGGRASPRRATSRALPPAGRHRRHRAERALGPVLRDDLGGRAPAPGEARLAADVGLVRADDEGAGHRLPEVRRSPADRGSPTSPPRTVSPRRAGPPGPARRRPRPTRRSPTG